MNARANIVMSVGCLSCAGPDLIPDLIHRKSATAAKTVVTSGMSSGTGDRYYLIKTAAQHPKCCATVNSVEVMSL
jgi:hypothetical protein